MLIKLLIEFITLTNNIKLHQTSNKKNKKILINKQLKMEQVNIKVKQKGQVKAKYNLKVLIKLIVKII
jgi:hypothetical protein